MMTSFAIATVGFAARFVPPPATLQLGPLLGRGNYGSVYAARFPSEPDLDIVAKCAFAAVPAEAELAAEYLGREAAANEDVLGFPEFCAYLGETTAEGERYLLFRRIRPPDGGDRPASCADLLQPAALAPREVLRQLLCALSRLHTAGYVHRDVKLENLLVDGSLDTPCVKLIDLGSAVSVDGCGLFERMFQGCALDGLTTPCSVLYAPPEKFADPDHPFSFDIYSASGLLLMIDNHNDTVRSRRWRHSLILRTRSPVYPRTHSHAHTHAQACTHTYMYMLFE